MLGTMQSLQRWNKTCLNIEAASFAWNSTWPASCFCKNPAAVEGDDHHLGSSGPWHSNSIKLEGAEIKFVLTFPPLLLAGLTRPPAGQQLVINCSVVLKGHPD